MPFISQKIKSEISEDFFHLNVCLEIITLRYGVIDQKINTCFFDFKVIHP